MSKNKRAEPTVTTNNVPAAPTPPIGKTLYGFAVESESTHTFVQFRDVIAVEDTRGQEELTDRARVGLMLGPHGVPVTAITLRDGWFLIATERRSYEVPVSNIRSARR